MGFKAFAVSRERGRGGDRENKISVPVKEGDLAIQPATGVFQREVADFLNWSMVDLQCCVSFRQGDAAMPSQAKLLQSCPTFCDPMDCSPPGSSLSLGFSRQD